MGTKKGIILTAFGNPGITLGAFLMSPRGREFSNRGGSSPFTPFILGLFVVVGFFRLLPLRVGHRLAGVA